MSREQDYKNLVDAKLLRGLQWDTIITQYYDADEDKYYLNASYNDLKALKESDANVVLHITEINGVDVADIYCFLSALWEQTSTTPPAYGAYFEGAYQQNYEADDPDADLQLTL